MMTGDSAEAAAEKGARLFRYLRELAGLRSKSTDSWDQYEDVVWFSDLPEGSRSRSAFDQDEDSGEESGDWLEVDRVEMPREPLPPEGVAHWVDSADLKNYRLDRPALLQTEGVDVPPDVLRQYWNYVQGDWLEWAQMSRRLAPLHGIYVQLFGMSARLAALGELYEMVVGIGLLTWRRNERSIARHLITTPVEIAVDADSGLLRVHPRDVEGRNRFELDMLDPADRGDPSVTQQITSSVESSVPLDLAHSSGELLRSWTLRADPSATFSAALARPVRADDRAQVTLAPAVLLRRRGNRSLVNLLNDIAVEIEAGEIPDGVARLVEIRGEEDGSAAFSTGVLEDPEIYFPLPSNDEQRRIVERIGRQQGLLVQGPPGTGKSQTIANLVCHLLAQGKRVLVTSHTERALKVLKEMIPAEVQPLCISLLGRDRDSIRNLEEAVAEISSRQASWSPEEGDADIERLRHRLQEVRASRAEKNAELRKIREAEVRSVALGSYRGTAQEIARILASERSEIGWIPDEVTVQAPPLTDAEFAEVIGLIETPRLADVTPTTKFPDLDVLLHPRRLSDLVRREEALNDEHGQSVERFGPGFATLESSDPTLLVSAANALAAFAHECAVLSSDSGWTPSAVRDILGNQPARWETLATELQAISTRVEPLAVKVAEVSVTGIEGMSTTEAKAAAEELASYVHKGGRLRRGLLARGAARRHRELLMRVRVDGHEVRSAEQLDLLLQHLELRSLLETLASTWRSFTEFHFDGTIRQVIAQYEAEQARLSRVLQLQAARSVGARALTSIGVSLNWNDIDAVNEEIEALKAASRLQELKSARAELAHGLEALGSGSHPIVKALRKAIRDRSVSQYEEALESLTKALEHRRLVRRKMELINQLRSAAPKTADFVVGYVEAGRSQMARFGDAWAWRFADCRLAELTEPGAAAKLQAAISRLTHTERSSLSQLAAALAWQRMFDELGPDKRSALSAWALAVRKIGKGKGKYAEMHRRTARQYLEEARDAIPVWIMPSYRVAENSTATPEVYDVVIIDEASQSSVESLFLFYLGRQVVVVGDDQQIAPEAVGIDTSEVRRLQREYLEGIPFGELYAPDNSLFGQAQVRFGGAIPLREHFRCMPEIIGFSNRVSYHQNALIPLRQYGQDRLDPIKTVFLPHGFREGKRRAFNKPEADEIVARIEKLCSDPRYDGLTLGVISLQGDAQARLIEGMLLERLGSQEYSARRVHCGDAYAFQGDERDVIFLSMVAAPNQRPGALTKASDRRRFNVAASRAKDQVWLVHSVLPQDLNPEGMRRRLLEYYFDPKIETFEFSDPGDELRSLPPPDPFDSWFEVDVFRRMTARRYRVKPQYPVAGYSIDLMVEGSRGRLAVECDGDKWHGPDRWEQDMARQRKLERCGLKFFRVRGSEFYRNPDAALEPLWDQLEQRGIHPGQPTGQVAWQIREEPLTSAQSSGDVTSANGVEQPSVDNEVVVDDQPSSAPSSSAPDAHPLQLRLGDRLHHPRKGDCFVARLVSPAAETDPAVTIIFESNESYSYTVAEYRKAGFVRWQELDHQSDETPPRVEGEYRIASFESGRPAMSGSSDLTEFNGSLAPYTTWEPRRRVPDPAHALVSDLVPVFLEIVETEGPIAKRLAFRRLIEAAGYRKLGGRLREKLEKTLTRVALRVPKATYSLPYSATPQVVLHSRDHPAVTIRERGPRKLFDVPLDEVAALASGLSAQGVFEDEDLKRKILSMYGLKRLTPAVDSYLTEAIRLSKGDQ